MKAFVSGAPNAPPNISPRVASTTNVIGFTFTMACSHPGMDLDPATFEEIDPASLKGVSTLVRLFRVRVSEGNERGGACRVYRAR